MEFITKLKCHLFELTRNVNLPSADNAFVELYSKKQLPVDNTEFVGLKFLINRILIRVNSPHIAGQAV